MATRLQLLKRIGLTALGVVVALYVAFNVGYFFFQRSLMYSPGGAAATQPRVPGANVAVERIATADGERLVAWHLPPKAGRPVVLFFHGNSGHLQGEVERFERMAKAGVGFLAISYRGYSGSTGDPTEDGLHEDARAAYAWLAQRYDANDIILHGFSLGSGLAVRLAAERPARALILEAPFTATVDLAAERYPWMPMRLMMRDRFLSREHIGQVDMPILIVHGDKDQSIPFHQGETLYRLAHGEKTLVKMQGSDHKTLTRDGLYDHVFAFLGVDRAGATTAAPGRQAAVQITRSQQAQRTAGTPLG